MLGNLLKNGSVDYTCLALSKHIYRSRLKSDSLNRLGEVHHELVEGDVLEGSVEGDLRLDEGADRGRVEFTLITIWKIVDTFIVIKLFKLSLGV